MTAKESMLEKRDAAFMNGPKNIGVMKREGVRSRI